jgi:hypothetical protein
VVSAPKNLSDLRRIEAQVKVTCTSCKATEIWELDALIAEVRSNGGNTDWHTARYAMKCPRRCASPIIALLPIPYGRQRARSQAHRHALVNLSLQILRDRRARCRGALVGFAGRRWRVESVDDRAKVLVVAPHRAGKLPKFDPPTGEPVHPRLSEEMRHVLGSEDVPSYLDPAARAFLQEGRAAYRRLGLDRSCAIAAGRDTVLATWAGTAANDILVILLRSAGLECEADDVALEIADCSPDELRKLLSSITEIPSTEALASFVENLRGAKYDQFVDDDLLRRLWAERAKSSREQAIATISDLLW